MIFFPIAEGGAKIFGVFRVKNHDFTPKIIFFPILGGCVPGAPAPGECIFWENLTGGMSLFVLGSSTSS